MTATEYRQVKLTRFAARFGMTIEQLSYSRRIQAQAQRRGRELRCDRRSGWPEIARKAAAHGRSWAVVL